MKKARAHRPHVCNVLGFEEGQRRLWQFATGGSRVALAGEHAGPLPAKVVGKDWTAIFKPVLNVAWLPPEQVFLRVAQLPSSDPQELHSMLEFQIERLSPMPVAQVVWTYQVLPPPHAGAPARTVIVIIVARSLVEEFLGKLEGEGYLADRLEVPFLHQLLATPVNEDGVWLYPEPAGNNTKFLVAWWYDGVLRELSLVLVPSLDNRAELLGREITQMAWAGELEGWLSHPPRWHLVAPPDVVAAWQPLLRAHAGDDVTAVELLPARALAERAAQQAAQGNGLANLLPPEYSARYRQRFIDRLWMRGLGAAVMVYILGVLIYLGVVQVFAFQKSRVDSEVRALTADYKKALEMRDRARILQEQANLKFAALDCWKVASELLPEGLTLDTFGFRGGRTMVVSGTADSASKVTDYNEAIRKVSLEGAGGPPLFASVTTPPIQQRPGPGGGTIITWSFSADLRRSE